MTAGGPEHFVRAATALGSPPLAFGAWNDLHLQTMKLKPGGWSHPGGPYVRLTVPMAADGRVRRRVPGGGKGWIFGVKRRGGVSLTPPGAEGHWEWLDPSEFGLLFLPETLMREGLDEAGADPSHLSLRPIFAETDPVVGAVFESLRGELGRTGRRSRLLISSASLYLARHLLRRYGSDPFATGGQTVRFDQKRLQRVVDAVDARLDYDWSVQELAREAGLSAFWFAHAFKAQTGVSPRRFVQRRRLACARRLLANSPLSLADVAAHCGFESQSWFTTSFRREFGVTPGAFRRATA